jgi:protein TonB
VAAAASVLLHLAALALALVLSARHEGAHRSLGTTHLISVTLTPPAQSAPAATQISAKPKLSSLVQPAPARTAALPLPRAQAVVASAGAAGRAAPPSAVPSPPSTHPANPAQDSLAQSEGKAQHEPDPAYVRLLWQRIHSRRPASADLSGSVVVIFVLDRAGGIVSARVGQTSGVMLLDRAALRAVNQAAPFPPPPADRDGAALTFSVSVHFGP